ncbi:MAG: sugar phosphate isomerase/epimerase family protein [Promethearchaeota archaeon]
MQIAVSTYSFREYIRNEGWTLNKIALTLKDLGIPYVEINNIFTTPEDFGENVKDFKENDVQTILLTIDGNNYFQTNSRGRKKQFEFMKKWIDAANNSGVKLIRANMGHSRSRKKPKALKRILNTFLPILDYCSQLEITHVFENHGSLSSNIEFQIMLLNKIKSLSKDKYFGYLVDTGNYSPKNLIYDNILKLSNSIKIVHAKMYSFNEDGEESVLNYEKIIKNLKQVGFDGFLSIEYEGKDDPLEGVKKSIQLLKKYIIN